MQVGDIVGPVHDRAGWLRTAAAIQSPATLIVNLVEATGGLSPPAAGRVWRLARRANVKGARDGTRYGKLRISPKSFVVHHVQRISMAAVIGDAGNIKDQVRASKSQALHRQMQSPDGH